MTGETNIRNLLKTVRPFLNEGEYVFCTIPSGPVIDQSKLIGSFKEKEGVTVILEKKFADSLNLDYTYVAA